MATQAIAAYGVRLMLGNGIPLAAVAVTGGTTATPIVLATAAHGVATGDVASVVVTGVAGLVGANGTWIAQAVDATHLTLRGSAGSGAYTSGGTVTQTDTYTVVAEVTDIQDAGIMCTVVEATAHDGNGYASRIPTFLSGNMMRLLCNWVPSHPTHDALTGLMYLMGQRVTRHYMLVWPGATRPTWFFSAWVTADRKSAPVAGVLGTSAQLEVDGPMLLAA